MLNVATSNRKEADARMFAEWEVIQLLQGMAEKGKKEKHEEQVQFAAYKQFCDDTTVEKQRAIKEATAKMEQLVAAIQKAEADAATLAKEIAQLDEDISVYEGDKKAATEVSRSFYFMIFHFNRMFGLVSQIDRVDRC